MWGWAAGRRGKAPGKRNCYDCAMTEQFIDLPERGVTLCVERAGDGPALLVVSGTGGDLRNRPNALSWPVAAHHDTVLYDQRCLGRSVQHDDDYQPSMADFGADALALVDHLGIDRFAAIGVSFGGMVAQELALLAGDRLTKLVLCCTSSGGDGGASYPLHELYRDGRSIDEVADLWDTRSATDEEVAAQMQRFFAGRPRPAEPPPGLLKQLEARRGHDTWERLPQIGCDTLVAYGRYDGVAPPANNEAIADRIPHATLAAFDGGHLFMFQDRAVWPTILNFLGDAG